MFFPSLLSLLPLLLAPSVSLAQSCDNYGTLSGASSCACPPGYGGSNCSVPACGGNIFQGTQRPLVQSGGMFGNVSTCSCQDGWIGTGCNVCQAPSSCQSAFNALSTQSSTGLANVTAGQNSTLTCNTAPRVYAAGELSCRVINPTLQSLFPLSSNLNILRTLSPALSPLPNTTSFGPDGTAFAQLIYNGVEQFTCGASSCKQTLSNGNKTSNYNCDTLNCTCRTGSDFCGKTPTSDLTGTINMLSGPLEIICDGPSSGQSAGNCSFKQSVLQSLFGPNGLSLSDCSFGECVRQFVIDTGGANGSTTEAAQDMGKSLSGGVIAGLAVVGTLLLLAGLVLLFGCWRQRVARSQRIPREYGGVGVKWTNISYFLPPTGFSLFSRSQKKSQPPTAIIRNLSGRAKPGEVTAILGPSGAGKTTLVEILSGKSKAGKVTGSIDFVGPDDQPLGRNPRIGFVDQLDILPPMLTPLEALLFSANLRLPESVPQADKLARAYDVLAKLGLNDIANTRIGNSEKRGISGGEMRRVSIGLELVGEPDVLILDEPTSGLDSVSAMKVVGVLRNVAHDPENPRVVICSIHQPSSKIYHIFDRVLVLAKGDCIYDGQGGHKAAEYLAAKGHPCPEDYNIADHFLDLASESNPQLVSTPESPSLEDGEGKEACPGTKEREKEKVLERAGAVPLAIGSAKHRSPSWSLSSSYATTFLTQLEVLAQREWKILRRDKTLFLTHFVVAAVLGVFCGGLYFKTDDTIGGFQSRIGCLFFVGALIAFSSLSALYNVVEVRALFLRERASGLYSPTAWLIARLIFDVVPLRLIPTIVVSSITYWMAGLAPLADHFFKYLFILVLYSLAMTLFNFLLATVFRQGGVAILLSALTALYQMTFAGFFVNLSDIPQVLRWLQWLCPLKYTLEALAINEVSSGLQIRDVLQGVPVNVSATLILNLLFGFGLNNYYRDVLVLFAFIAGFGLGTIAVVWLNVRERK